MSANEPKPRGAKLGMAARILMSAVGIIVLIVGLFQFSSGVKTLSRTMGGSNDIAIASKAATAAAQTFVAKTADVAEDGNAPRQIDGAVALLDKVFDTGVLRGRTSTPADLPAVADWMLADVKVGFIYLLAGTGERNPNH